jgi:hypothetical protein
MRFWRTGVVAGLLLVSMPAQAQQAPSEAEPKWKTLELKHLTQEMATTDRIARITQLIQKLTSGKVEIYHDPVLKVLMIRGPDDQTALAEQLFRRFDVPDARHEYRKPSQIIVTIHLVEASKAAEGDSNLPAALDSAAKQLTNTLGYKRLRLLDTVFLQGKEYSAASLSGLLPMSATPTSEKHFYTARYERAHYSPEEKTVHLDEFRFEIRIPVSSGVGNVTYGESAVQSNLSIRAGQTLVLGKLSKDQVMPGEDRGVFLMVTAKAE